MTIKIQYSYKICVDKETDNYYNILNRNDIVKFTYEDYLKCLKQKEWKEQNILKEEKAEYTLMSSNFNIETNEKSEYINNQYDKTYRKILSNKKDVTYIINRAINVKINPEEIEKYKSSFVTDEYGNREADVVYKLKNRNIFFLIEHQTKVDYAMPYRIEEYRLEVMKSAIDVKKIKTKGYEFPTVIPIVIYTGKKKWSVRKYLSEIQDERFSKVDLFKYNLVDINEYTNEELLKSDNFIDKIFLMEKTKDKEEFITVLKEIISKIKDQEQIRTLKIIIQYTLKGRIDEEQISEILNNIKKEDKNMLAFVEMIREEDRKIRQEGRQEGRREAISQIIVNMLKRGMKVAEIKEITGTTKKEIEQAKKLISM